MSFVAGDAQMPSIGLCAQLACIWEATARKPGNVHRARDFGDASYLDFLLSAAAVAPVFENACQRRVGETVLEAIRATRRVVSTNTNLGIVLLLAPLAAVPAEEDLRTGLARVLDGLDITDAQAVYQAIRLAQPSGLGQVRDQDVAQEPTQTLRQVMQLAAPKDTIALQYATGYRAVLEEGLPALQEGLKFGRLESAIIYCHLWWLANYPDSLIARKRGVAEAEAASQAARQVLGKQWPANPEGWTALAELDTWLCASANARNPGTSADLVAACLFVALRRGIITLPSPFAWPSAMESSRADRC
jgi:triphosphoribosyl-dephospho-CoA synthase